MKRIISNILSGFVVVAFAFHLSGGITAAAAADLTAFQLVKEANKHVGEEAKGKVVQIRSEKSVASLTPVIWYVVLYDSDATAKATEVKFSAGQKIAVKRPARILELASGKYQPLEKEKLKIDSDRAIKIAVGEPTLKNIKVVATRLTLERWEEMPVWKVRLWAAKLRDAQKDADIGQVFISAADGKVVKNELHIERVD